MRLLSFIFILAALQLDIYSQKIYINEIMQSNINSVIDENYEFPRSWVELYNPSDESINIKNWKIATSQSKWTISTSVYIAPKEYLIIFCDEKRNGIHTNFYLSLKKNGAIYLYNQADSLIDEITNIKKFPAPEISFGRRNDGSDSLVYFINSTPGRSNNNTNTAEEMAPEIEFNVKGGIFYEPIELTLSHREILDSSLNKGIYYTNDGSEPTFKSKKYNERITINKSTVIRAKYLSDQYLPNPSSTETFLFPDRELGLPIVSITSDPKYIDDDTLGIYDVGIFTDIHGCWGSSGAFWTNRKRPINIEYYPDNKSSSVINQLADMRIGGGCSRFFDQKTLVIYANKRLGNNKFEYPLFPEKEDNKEYGSFLLRNSGNDNSLTFIRDAACQQFLAQKYDIDYQAYQPTILYVNGFYWGIHNMRERSNDDFVKSNYDNLEDIDLVENWNSLENGTIDMFKKLINIPLSNDSIPYDSLSKIIDIEETINYLICEIFVANTDFPLNNIVLWRNRDNGKWRFILKDLDLGVGTWNTSPSINYLNFLNQKEPFDTTIAYTELGGRVFKFLFKQKQFQKDFIDRYMTYLGDILTPNACNDIIDSLSLMIEKEIPFHNKHWNTIYNWEDNVSDMKDWISKRNLYAYKDMSEYFDMEEPIPFKVVISDSPSLKSPQIYINGINLIHNSFNGCAFPNRNIPLSINQNVTWKVIYNTHAGYHESNISNTSEISITPKSDTKSIYCTVINTSDDDDVITECFHIETKGHWLFIKTTNFIKNISLFDLQGREVSFSKINSDTYYIKNPGLYFVKIEGASSIKVYKVVIS